MFSSLPSSSCSSTDMSMTEVVFLRFARRAVVGGALVDLRAVEAATLDCLDRRAGVGAGSGVRGDDSSSSSSSPEKELRSVLLASSSSSMAFVKVS
mmetsp:Transcript_14133/g.22959  ORF Transcript_14133/g.22959 Transcript_14133/m.22959 type:complete len:96 (+) Transcript_14133:881-1168(+)